MARAPPLQPPQLQSPPLQSPLLLLLLLLLLAGCSAHSAKRETSDLKSFNTGAPVLLYTTKHEVKSINVSKPNVTTTIVKNLEEEAPVDFYYKNNLICWAETISEKIFCRTYNGSHENEKPEIVLSGITPNGLTIDWYTQKLYWTDKEMLRIEVASLDTHHRKVLFWLEIDQPRAIAVAPMKGLLFWTDWGEVAKIERAGMNGDPNTRKVIVDSNIFWPNGLTIDYVTNKIYWLDAKLNFIDMMDFDGKNRVNIMRNQLIYPFALTIYDAKLYWTDWKTWYIYSWDINTNGPLKKIILSEHVPGDIRVWDPRRQPQPAGLNPCSINNGNCSHLCLLSPNAPGFSCACPTGVKLLNNYKCADRPQAQIILVQKMAISRISLDSPDYTSFVIPLRGIKSAVNVDYDNVNGYIYWTDGEACTISRSKIDGTDQSIVIQGDLRNPDGLAIDNVAGNIYWTDPTADTITMARIDGSSRKVLINEDLDDPRAIALAPSLGWMFWSDWSKHRIERASLDGTDRLILISKDISWPNGIALDIEARKIYWGDGLNHKIELSNMDGTDRRELLSENLHHIFGVSLLGDYLYWTDWQRRSLSRVHKVTGREREIIADQFHSVMGLKAFTLKNEVVSNQCSFNNGNCSHFCFNRPNDVVVCGCPIGLEFVKDNKTCVKPAAFILYARKDKIGRLSIENSNNDAYLPIKDIKYPSALTIHAAEGRLYWADSKFRTINRCAINGSNTEKVIEWTYGVECLALDWCGYNLYWTDSIANRIEVLSLNSSSRRALIWSGLKKPNSIAVDPVRGYMYWSEWGGKTIKRAAMDGSHPEVLVDQIIHARALNIDYEKGQLIWGTLEPPKIEIANLDGTNRRQLKGNIEMPYSITIYQDYIYWANWNSGDIGSASMTNGSNQSNIYPKLEYIADIVVYHESRQVGTNQCSFNNGGCSHLCLSIPNKQYKCACPTHYVLNKDNLTCSAPSEFIMFIHRNGIGRIVTGGSDCPDATFAPGLKSVKAIEYDPVHKNIYWIDGRTHSIRYLSELEGGQVSILAKGLGVSANIALDAIGRAMYFTCPETNTINVTKLDNNSASVGFVIQGESMTPGHVVVHQTKRLLFWVDRRKGAIMSSALDGTNVMDVAHGSNITSLTLDPYTDTIYWGNSNQIYASMLNGTNSRIIWQGGNAMSLAVLKSTLYWIDKNKQLMHLPLNIKEAPASPVLSSVRLAPAINYVVAVYKLNTKHACMNGGRCNGICLADGVCGCASGLLSQGNENRCSMPPPCGANHFACSPNQPSRSINLVDKTQSRDCIPLAWRCDHQDDCPNGSDELDCNPCPVDKYKCPDGQCIEMSQVCDGTNQCSDGHDESHCCNTRSFQCKGTKVCIQENLVCDQWEHCADGADEAPALCNERKAASHPPVANTKSAYVFGIIGIVSILFTIWVFFWCHKKICQSYHYPPDDKAADPLSPKLTNHKTGTVCPSTSSVPRPTKMSMKIIEGMRMSSLGGSSTNSYDRNHITGASSSCTNGSSFLGRYPREPLNPPPSPVTTAPSSNAPSRHRPYRHYRVINQPPPPTPCSTDVCDESDCTISYPTLGFGTYLEAPPPTPCPPSPPSPSSRSSTYFSPLPPPPSPVPQHYDS